MFLSAAHALYISVSFHHHPKNVTVLALFCIVGMCLRMAFAWWNVTVGSSEGQEL